MSAGSDTAYELSIALSKLQAIKDFVSAPDGALSSEADYEMEMVAWRQRAVWREIILGIIKMDEDG
jgi:hypothetical protein